MSLAWASWRLHLKKHFCSRLRLPVEKAAVKLFEKEEDYLKEVNPVAEGNTDEKGVVKFKDLKSIPYFVLVRKGDKDNAGGGEQIGKLEEGKFNKATVVIQ